MINFQPMTDENLDKALRVLGPKLVLSIFRLSQKQLENFDEKINELIEEKLKHSVNV